MADVLSFGDDAVLPFAVEALDMRGRIARLGPALDTILTRHAYPAPVAQLLGEAAALCVLLGTTLKDEGRFQLQTRTDGVVDLLVVDFDAPDRLRAFARFDARKLAALAAGDREHLLGRGHLAFTIEQGGENARYQGVAPVEAGSLEQAALSYFTQSEQIPSFVRLAVGQVVTPQGSQWRAGGLLAQFLPHSPERRRMADFHPGDAPEGHVTSGIFGRRSLDRSPAARRHRRGSRIARSRPVQRRSGVAAVQRARRQGVSAAPAARGLPLLRRADRGDAAQLFASRSATTWWRRRPDHRDLRILLDETGL